MNDRAPETPDRARDETDPDEPAFGDEETTKERLNRKLEELLQELRVALPGVQVLFAFLLTLPFTSRFAQIDDLDRGVYFSAFLAAALSSVFLIAPSAYHRLRWRFTDRETMGEKQRMLVTASRQAIGGVVLLAVAMGSVVFLVSDVLFNLRVAGVAAGIVAAAMTWLWFGLPLTRRAGDPSQPLVRR